MTIQKRYSENDSVVTIAVSGNFDFQNLIEFRESYTEGVTKGNNFIINLSETTSIDSSVLGMLLNMKRDLGKLDGEIKIVRCNQNVKNVLQISNFYKKFNIS